jgi:hypothetical protein
MIVAAAGRAGRVANMIDNSLARRRVPGPRWSRHLVGLALALSLWPGTVPASLAQLAGERVLDHIADLGPAILACWRPPRDSAGMELTLVFSFKRNGEIFGKPRISYAKLRGDQDLQERFVASALKALADCTPLRIAPGLGGAIAGRPFSMLFRASAPSEGA